MTAMSMVQALNSAMEVMLARDPRVVILGEDVGYFGGVFRATEGLQSRYGAHRVIDTPIAEGGIVGAAIGMAANGLRPVAEIQFADYIYPAYDQIVSELARMRYRSAAAFTAPVTIRTPCGGGIRGGMTYGATDDYGYKSVHNKVGIHDLHATLLHLLGIDHERLTYRFGGRDYRLTDVHGEVIRGILA